MGRIQSGRTRAHNHYIDISRHALRAHADPGAQRAQEVPPRNGHC